jgi:hypothetical protein
MKILISIFLACFSIACFSQQPDSIVVEDFSMYGEAELAGGAKRFCTSKVFDLSPNKLISIGYDYQAPYKMEFGAIGAQSSQEITNRNNYGLRFAANVPLISKTNVLFNMGATYSETFYNFSNETAINPLARSLQHYGLRTMGLNFTLFKPINEKSFFILNDFQSLSYTKISATGIYGWKKHDRLMYGFGVARSYRVGEANYFPVLLYNYTFNNRKWGIEALFPAKASLRRTFSARTIAFFGYELEGNSYLIRNRGNEFAPGMDMLELRRGELRVRCVFERSIKDFIWVSVQAGWRYNYRFNVDEREFFRGFGDAPYFSNNLLTNPLFINFSLNLVSP